MPRLPIAAVTPLLALATALMVTAMVAFPGGSASSPHANAFVPWRDYFCDLLAERTASDRDNTFGMVCARLGMVLTAVALWPLWRDGIVARPWPARQRVIRWAGALSVLAMPAVAWSPSGAWPIWHSIALLLAGVPGGVALVLTAASLWQTRQQRPGTARLTVLFGIAAAAVALLWTLCFVATWPATPLANAQKIAWLLLLAWAVALARAV